MYWEHILSIVEDLLFNHHQSILRERPFTLKMGVMGFFTKKKYSVFLGCEKNIYSEVMGLKEKMLCSQHR